jgi:hypothetical protein
MSEWGLQVSIPANFAFADSMFLRNLLANANLPGDTSALHMLCSTKTWLGARYLVAPKQLTSLFNIGTFSI